MSHSESELRGMMTTAQKTIEEIAYRCARRGGTGKAQGWGLAAISIVEAINSIERAKLCVVEAANIEDGGEA
jgi:hypothetical protein